MASSRKRQVPDRDADLLTFGQNFRTFATAHAAQLKISAAVITTLDLQGSQFEGDMIAEATARAAAKQATATKRASKKAYQGNLRTISTQLLADPGIPDALIEGIGLTPHDTQSTPVTEPLNVPALSLAPRVGARLALRTLPEGNQDAGNRARVKLPDNVTGILTEIAVLATDAPLPGPDSPLWKAGPLLTRATGELEFDPRDAGKTAAVRARYLGTRGRLGPIGPTSTGTIAA